MSTESNKIEAMNAILVKLEDIQSSQIALIQKLAQLQLNLFDSPDEELESGIVDLHSDTSLHADALRDLVEKYTMKVNVVNQDYTPVSAPPEGTAEA